LVLNLFILIIVYTYIPNIAEFKAEGAFLKLYDQIPYFANIFRYAYVSQNFGYIAIPIFFYFLSKSDKKSALISLLLSFSSLISGFAFYSRAQIFTFVLVFITYFFLIKSTLPFTIRKLSIRYLKILSLIIIFLFISITIIRFSSMDYYGDRIPVNSFIQNPILYSIFDYASQGFSNGYNQLESYNQSKNLYGEQLLRDLYQMLNFIGLISWDANVSQEKIDFAYNYDGGAFNGYTAQLVYNFGYPISLFISIIYFVTVKFMFYRKNNLFLESNFIIILLLFIPIVSIFYVGYTMLYYPFFFLILTKLLYKIKMLFH
jgi:oligosaccharide repeat unit polymerase